MDIGRLQETAPATGSSIPRSMPLRLQLAVSGSVHCVPSNYLRISRPGPHRGLIDCNSFVGTSSSCTPFLKTDFTPIHLGSDLLAVHTVSCPQADEAVWQGLWE